LKIHDAKGKNRIRTAVTSVTPDDLTAGGRGGGEEDAAKSEIQNEHAKLEEWRTYLASQTEATYTYIQLVLQSSF
jgi:hypothetical protein